MFEAPAHPDLVPFDGSFQLAAVSTRPGPERPRGKEAKKLLKKMKPELDELQRILYAHDSHAVLLVFQHDR